MSVVFVVFLVAVSSAQALFVNECTALLGENYWNPKQTVREIAVEVCTNGQVYWSDPKGEAFLTYKSETNTTSFEVCFTFANDKFDSFERTDSGKKYAPADYGVEGFCLTSLNGQIPLKVKAIDMQLYVANAWYSVSIATKL